MIASHWVGSEKNASPSQTEDFSTTCRVARRRDARYEAEDDREIVPSRSIGSVFLSGCQSCGSTGWRFWNERPMSPWRGP